MMQAIVCDRPVDDLSTTTLTTTSIPEPGEGEVRVRVQVAALNPVDWKLCAGVAPWWKEPRVVGLDAAGIIDKVGTGVTEFSPGESVVWHGNLNRNGVFAEYATTPAHVLSRIPPGVAFDAAAALPCAGITAYQALVRKIKLSPEQTIVIQGATGGVGGFAVQIARNIGSRVIALAKPEKFERARSLGADEVLDYRRDDLRTAIREITQGRGADAMLEVVNPKDARKSLDLLCYNGHLASIDPLPDLSLTPPYTYAASIHEVALGGAYGAGDLITQRDFSVMGNALLKWLTEGMIDPMIEHRIDMSEVPDFLNRLRRRAYDGKAVVMIGNGA